MYLLTAYAIFAPASWQPMLGSINAISIIILIIYVILIIKQPKESDDEEEKKKIAFSNPFLLHRSNYILITFRNF